MADMISSQRKDRRRRSASADMAEQDPAVKQTSSRRRNEAKTQKTGVASPVNIIKELARPEGGRERRRQDRRENKRRALEEVQNQEAPVREVSAVNRSYASHSATLPAVSKRQASSNWGRSGSDDFTSRSASETAGRSDALRQRRSQATPVLKPGLTSMAGPGARRAKLRSMGAQAPVVSRGGVAGVPASRSVTNNPRRRYDIALGVPGAEIRLPAMPQIQVGWRLISGLLVVMMLASLYLMLLTPYFEVKGVEVVGMQRLTSIDINLALGVVGETIFAIDPAALQQRLETAFPEIASQQLTIGLPHSVDLVIEERIPVLSWVEDGQEVWVDAEGVSFQPRGEALELLSVRAAGLPLGAERAETSLDLKLQPELVQKMLAMQPYLPEGAQLMYDHDRGFGWEDSRGWEVYFGQQTVDIDQKLATYQTLVDTLTGKGIQPVLISVEYLHAPYFRLER